MENENLFEKIAINVGQQASVKNVFGEPIRVGDKTIVPVAQVAFGMGGGYGKAGKPLRKAGVVPTTSAIASTDGGEPADTGAGGGGGGMATPKGVYEITATSTRFIPTNNMRQLALSFAAGFLIKAFFFSGWLRPKK